MNTPTETTRVPAAPVAEDDRIHSIDILRGFALFGVLLMNMQAFAMLLSAYMNPTSYGDQSSVNYFLWCLNHVFADAKFITIFSMLFGAGIVLMTERSTARTGRSAGVHYRRMLWMALFGAAHGILLWYGDILLWYAMCGLLAYLFRRLKPWILILVAVILLLIPVLLLANFDSLIENAPADERQEMIDMWSPSPDAIKARETAYRGGYLDHLPTRFESWTGMFGFMMLFGWRLLAVMLLGMALFKSGVFSAARSRGFYVALVLIGFAAGLPLAAYGIYNYQACNWDMAQSMGPGSLYNYFGSLLVAFGWIGLVMLLCRSDRLKALRGRLAAVGRMAFTNYIMHSVILTTLFYGHGFGLFGRVDRPGQLGIVLAVFALQLWYSQPWLERFRFGPLEWLWRSLTYWRRQAFLRRGAT
ncbi:MAG: DUF418 domain-containing protein [Planctomycetota bacterium]